MSVFLCLVKLGPNRALMALATPKFASSAYGSILSASR